MQWFRNLKISIKIMGLSALMILLILVLGASGFITTNKLGTSLNSMFTNELQPIEYLSQAREDLASGRADIRAALLTTDTTTQSNFIKLANTKVDDAKSQLGTYEGTTLNAKAQKIAAQVQSGIKSYSSTLSQVEADITNGDSTTATSLTQSTLETQGANLSNLLSQLSAVNHANAVQAQANAHSLRLTAEIVLVGILLLAVLLGLGASIAITRSISSGLQKVVSLVSKVSKGDLRETAEIDSKDEIGQMAQSVNDMVIQLREIMSGILSASENVSAASQEISAATEQIASGSTSQAESAETVNQLFKELSIAINSVAKNAEDAAELSSRTVDMAHKGESIVNSSVSGMNRVSEQMTKLSEDSNRVGEIVEVIDDIAEQTNLLALNAAIEAARAGDQGRGFAVVADEVRKLAERSSDATKQITTIIKTMQANTEASVQAVNDGVASTQQSGDAFTEIASMVTQSSDKVNEIAAAGEEQAAQASEVLVSVETIAAAAEESAASSEETASSTQSLAQLAEELNGYVSVFRIS